MGKKVEITATWRRAWTGANQKPVELPKGVTPTQLATYTLVSRVLLNLDETITKE